MYLNINQHFSRKDFCPPSVNWLQLLRRVVLGIAKVQGWRIRGYSLFSVVRKQARLDPAITLIEQLIARHSLVPERVLSSLQFVPDRIYANLLIKQYRCVYTFIISASLKSPLSIIASSGISIQPFFYYHKCLHGEDFVIDYFSTLIIMT